MGRFFAYVKSLWGGASAVALAGPVALWAPGLEPPWPEGTAAIIALLFCVVALLIAYAGFHRLASQSKNVERMRNWARSIGCLALGSALVFCATYLYSYASYVEVLDYPDRVVRRVIGTITIDPEFADRNPEDLLRENQLKPEKIWTRQSLTNTRMLVLFSYVAMFFFLTFGFSSLAMAFLSVDDNPSTASSKGAQNDELSE